MDPYSFGLNAKNYHRPPATQIQLDRWIAENDSLVKRLVALSGGDSRKRAAKEFLAKWGGTWERGLWYWSLGERWGIAAAGADDQEREEFDLDSRVGDQE